MVGSASVCYAPWIKPNQLPLVASFACLSSLVLMSWLCARQVAVFREQICCVYTIMMAPAQQGPLPPPHLHPD